MLFMLKPQYHGPTPSPPADPCLHPHVWVWLWRKCWCCWWRRVGVVGWGGGVGRWQGCPRHVCFLGRTMHLSELLLKEATGIWVHRQLAGSMLPTHPPSPTPRPHTQTHTLQLTGTGLSLHIYQSQANKTLSEKVMSQFIRRVFCFSRR